MLTLIKTPEPFPGGSESATRLEPGPWPVGTFEEVFVDTSRATNANGDFAGAATRTLTTSVWYPQGAREPYPLLILSHGFSSNRHNLAYLSSHLASHGYVVAAPDYPLTNLSTPGGPSLGDVANQPGDVSFLIDQLLAHGAEDAHPLAGSVDGSRVGVAGISLGGLTSTLAGLHPLLRDSRIRAVISIAGPMTLFEPDFFAGEGPPFLMLAGTADVLVPHALHAQPVPELISGSLLLSLREGSHAGFSGGMRFFRALPNPDIIGCYAVQSNIAEGEQAEWNGLLGPAELGINYDAPAGLCEQERYPKAMNVLRQQMLARVIITAFFDAQFAPTQQERDAADRYLRDVIASELPDVLVTSAR
ncbi:MAG: hypothetical protein AAF756_19970 [Pseudomonadota bacterium]